MDMNLEVLQYINETAIKAAGMRDYDISPTCTRHVRSDGTVVDTETKYAPETELLDLDSVVSVYKVSDSGEVFVGDAKIVVTNSHDRRWGKSVCKLTKSAAIDTMISGQGKSMKPETFEKIAKLYFGADLPFLQTIRNLKWIEKTDASAKLSAVSKSADIQAIAQVLTDDDILFQDIVLEVETPFFLLPYRTTPVKIDVHIYAHPTEKTITFMPDDEAFMLAKQKSIKEVQKALNAMIGKDVVLMGEPTM
jgi:hypothetical protein